VLPLPAVILLEHDSSDQSDKADVVGEDPVGISVALGIFDMPFRWVG
jgi:hypothetical protein